MFPPNGEGSPRHVHARPARRIGYPDLSAVALFARAMGKAERNAVGPDSWPAWTDAPVEFLDYDAFDDEGDLLADTLDEEAC